MRVVYDAFDFSSSTHHAEEILQNDDMVISNTSNKIF